MGIQKGTVGGRLSARSKPVTAALKSFIVTFCLVNFCHIASAPTQEAIDIRIINKAENLKNHTPAIAAGSSAIKTSPIIPCTVSFERI